MRWIVYDRARHVIVDGRELVTKVPVNHADPSLHAIDAQDSRNWITGHAAELAAKFLNSQLGREQYGIGYVLTEGCGIACIDIDKALVNGEWSPLSQELCARFSGAYVEVSQSGTALHIFFSYTGAMPLHKKKNVPLHIELYSSLRFIGITGTNSTGSPLYDATAILPKLIADYFTPSAEILDPTTWTTEPNPTWDGPEDDDELIRRALAARASAGSVFGSKAKFADLWYADESALARAFPAQSTGKTYDGSSADLALANHLGFWTGGNCDRMLRLMLRSELKREKWERSDYLNGTIVRAATQKSYYRQRPNDDAVAAPDQTVSNAVPVPPPPLAAPGALVTIEGVPAPPDSMPIPAPPLTGRGNVVTGPAQLELFGGWVYVEDLHRVVAPDGDILDGQRFDVRFGGRTAFLMTSDGSGPTDSAWECFTKSKMIDFPKTRGMFFDPREAPGAIVKREGRLYINSWSPVVIRSEPGDPSPFINHIKKLYPTRDGVDDWRIILNYLKFMVQCKGVKSTWWPFLQGAPGNGKSFISETMEYCIGQKYTQKPTPKNIDSQFNASLYGCLFIALEDVKIKEDHGALWETLKPMITQTRLEIQPKGIDKVTREICFNGILNSNHRDGIRKEPDDRRLAPFFAAQQRKSDLARDGLTPQYFTELWSWAKADGWAHVAYYLEHEPMDDEYNPATRCMIAPITSSTAEAIALGLGAAEQEIIEATRARIEGFIGGWINSHKFDLLLNSIGKGRAIPRAKRREMLESLGYVLHPSLNDGRFATLLTDGKNPQIYVKEGHDSIAVKDAATVKHMYEAAQRAP